MAEIEAMLFQIELLIPLGDLCDLRMIEIQRATFRRSVIHAPEMRSS